MKLHVRSLISSQEVDRLHKLTPVLEKAGYDHIFAAGPQKKHGCLIAYHRDKYSICGKSSVCYDDQNVRQGDKRSSRGSSFRTKNIASLVALKTFAGGGAGFIVWVNFAIHPAVFNVYLPGPPRISSGIQGDPYIVFHLL